MEGKFAKAFDEWMRRYLEEPEKFQREFEDVMAYRIGTYGEACSAYFIKLLDEV